MDEKPERVEGFRLLWPCFVATTFMWGAAMSLVVGMPEGSTAARAVALLGLSMIVLTFVVLHQINKRGKMIAMWYLAPLFMASIITGTLVGDWLIHLFK